MLLGTKKTEKQAAVHNLQAAISQSEASANTFVKKS